MKKRYLLAILCTVLALTVVALLPVTLHMASAEETYTITWMNDDGTKLAVTEVIAGETPIYSGETPTKETDADYVYTFYGWDPELVPATADATYTAIYSAQIRPDKCGDNLYWSFDESSGTLTIIGSGEMTDYYSSTIPWYSIRKRIITVILPDELTCIGDNAFYNCSALTSVKLGSSITRVGSHAFENTSLFSSQTGLVYLDYLLLGYNGTYPQTVSIRPSTRIIGDRALYNCTLLNSLTIPNSVTNIGQYAFYGCAGLQTLTMPCSICLHTYPFLNCSNITNIHLTIGSGIMTDYSSGIGTNQINNYGYTPWYQSRNNMLTITLEEGINNIGEYAFSFCTGIDHIIIPDGVTDIGQHAFYGCTGLQTLTIKDSVTDIGQYAFYGCTALQTLTMPCSVNFANNSFIGCSAITNVHLSKGTGTMTNYSEPYGFNVTVPWYQSRSNSLTVSLDDGIQNIGNYAFYYCTGLMLISIPSSVTSVGDNTFYACTSLTDVWYNGTRYDRANKLTINNGNYSLLNATWHYLTEAIDGTIEWNSADVKYKGSTPYVIANGAAQTPRFVVKNSADGSVVDPEFYDYEYRENTNAGTGYVIVTFKGDYSGTAQGWFKIYLPATENTYVENVSNGIKLKWDPVEGAAGYVIYRRAWSSTTSGWTTFERWNNVTGTTYIDGADANHKVYAGSRYQYGVKAYFARRTDPVSGATIGGNVGDNFNLGEVGPLRTTVRITTRKLVQARPGSKQMTVKWEASKNFTGYQIKYATDANFTKNVKAIKIGDPTTYWTTIKELQSNTTYYVCIRSYHEFGGMTYFGEWSNVLSCKVK